MSASSCPTTPTPGDSICTSSSPLDAACVDTWGNQDVDYTCSTDTCSASSCRELRQILWEATRSVGCATAACPDNTFVAVCRYSSIGNVDGERPFPQPACDTSPPPCNAPCGPAQDCSGVGTCCNEDCLCDVGFQPSDAARDDCAAASSVTLYGNNVIGVPVSVSSSVFGQHYTFVVLRPYASNPSASAFTSATRRSLLQQQNPPPPPPPPAPPITITLTAPGLNPGAGVPTFYLAPGVAQPTDTNNVAASVATSSGDSSTLTWAPETGDPSTLISLGVIADVDTTFTLTMTLSAPAGSAGTGGGGGDKDEDGITDQIWFLPAVGGAALLILICVIVAVVCCIRRSSDKASYLVAGDTFVNTSDADALQTNAIGMGTLTMAPTGGGGGGFDSAPARALPARPDAPSSSDIRSIIYDYQPTNGDELKLVKGGSVAVLETYDDGWALGLIGKEKGMFPLTYVTDA